MRELIDLAPLHQPKSLAALDAVTRALPSLPAVACFDTAFHATIPVAAATYALPGRVARALGTAPLRLPRPLARLGRTARASSCSERDASGLRIVSCHLGAGASLCAINDGSSLDTTMGFTPLEGLVMATRSGSVDPGMLLWLLEHEELLRGGARRRARAPLWAAGPRGQRRHARDPRAGRGAVTRPAQLALDVYVHRLRAGIAAMAASTRRPRRARVHRRRRRALGRGARAARRRARVPGRRARRRCATSEPRRGRARSRRTRASAARLCSTAREDLEIARQVRTLLSR